ncbi:MAG: hypothetical protein ABEJ98_01180 [Candidatus Nanohaloarchaea archaeon]
MTDENVPSSGYGDVYDAMGVESPFHALDEEPADSESYAGEIAAYRERQDYEAAEQLCRDLEDIFEATDYFPILMVDGEGVMPVALGRYEESSQVHPDFYLDATETNLDAVDLVFEESDYRGEMMDLFEETVEEVPDLTLEHRKPFSDTGILQGAWLAPGIEHLYNLEEIEEERAETGFF